MKILYYPVELYRPETNSMPTKSSDGAVLTIKEVAEYLKVTERTIYRLAAAKKIPAFKVGGTWRFRTIDIEGWIAAQSKKLGGAD